MSALVAANHIAYEVVHLAGAAFLLWLGLRALLSRTTDTQVAAAPDRPSARRPALTAARKGLVNSLANPKLAVFFVSLFPQFIRPGTAVLPAALAMAAVIVVFDVLWYGTVALLVDRVREALAERLLRRLQRLTSAVLVVFGIRLATERR